MTIKNQTMARTTIFLFLCVLSLYHVCFVTSSLEPYTVKVIDGKIKNLVAHISSNNKDFGNRTMTLGNKFEWSFRRDADEMTRFRGEFFWMSPKNTVYREANFHVFDNDVAVECGESRLKSNTCLWLVTETGFYFSKGKPSGWVFMYHWQTPGVMKAT